MLKLYLRFNANRKEWKYTGGVLEVYWRRSEGVVAEKRQKNGGKAAQKHPLH